MLERDEVVGEARKKHECRYMIRSFKNAGILECVLVVFQCVYDHVDSGSFSSPQVALSIARILYVVIIYFLSRKYHSLLRISGLLLWPVAFLFVEGAIYQGLFQNQYLFALYILTPPFQLFF